MRVAIYARVSTDDKGQDVENQLTVLRDWAKRLGYDEVLEYIDKGISGANSNRPAFIKMRADARQNLFKGILIWSIDRFSREGISQTFAYLQELERFGVFLRSYQEGWLDTADSMIKPLLLSMWSWMASFERQRISQRIKAGIQRQRNLGVYKGGRPGKTKPISENCNFNKLNNKWECKECHARFSSENIYKKKWSSHLRRHKWLKENNLSENTPPEIIDTILDGGN
jgi:DNA invertase Pin-like site-specific DNA recombinase